MAEERIRLRKFGVVEREFAVRGRKFATLEDFTNAYLGYEEKVYTFEDESKAVQFIFEDAEKNQLQFMGTYGDYSKIAVGDRCRRYEFAGRHTVRYEFEDATEQLMFYQRKDIKAYEYKGKRGIKSLTDEIDRQLTAKKKAYKTLSDSYVKHITRPLDVLKERYDEYNEGTNESVCDSMIYGRRMTFEEYVGYLMDYYTKSALQLGCFLDYE